MMTDDSLTTEAILDAFATAGRVLPRAALKQAADRWPEVGPDLIAMLEAVAEGDAVTDRTLEHLVPSDRMIVMTRRRLYEAAWALREQGTPGCA